MWTMRAAMLCALCYAGSTIPSAEADEQNRLLEKWTRSVGLGPNSTAVRSQLANPTAMTTETELHPEIAIDPSAVAYLNNNPGVVDNIKEWIAKPRSTPFSGAASEQSQPQPPYEFNDPNVVPLATGEAPSPELAGLKGGDQILKKYERGGINALKDSGTPDGAHGSFLKPAQPNQAKTFVVKKDEGMTFTNSTGKLVQIKEAPIQLKTTANATEFAKIVHSKMGGHLSDLHREVPAPDSKWYLDISSSASAAPSQNDESSSSLSIEAGPVVALLGRQPPL